MEDITDSVNGFDMHEVFGQSTQDKEKRIGIIRDDRIREDRMCTAAAGTPDPENTETVGYRNAADEINRKAVVVSVNAALALPATGWTDLDMDVE